MAHTTVLLLEAVQAVITDKNGQYADCTFGRGGHSNALLNQLDGAAQLVAVDKDPAAIQEAAKISDPRFTIKHGSFAELANLVDDGWCGRMSGILLDLGVSSPQLDDAERGFSFLRDGDLDMRMDPSTGQSAAEWIATVSFENLVYVLKTYGEERFAKRIAVAIIEARDQQAITRTTQLADIVARAHPAWEKHKHPATKSFQAIRIHINRELADLEAVLPQCLELLAPGGRLTVISFHSLEDRIVKTFMRNESRGPQLPASVPVTADQQRGSLKLLGKAVKPSRQEVEDNPRARSAVMRVAERTTLRVH